MTHPRLRTLWRAFVPSTPRTHDLRYDRDVGESGLSPVSSARSQSARIGNCDFRRGRTSPPDHCVQTSALWRKTQSSNKKYVPDTEGASSCHTGAPTFLHQEPAGPHRELRCPPGTYFSPRSLRSNPSDLEENAVLDHQVRPRHRAQPHPRRLPTCRGHTPAGSARCSPTPARRSQISHCPELVSTTCAGVLKSLP